MSIPLLLAFAATIPAANWMIGNVGDCAGPVCTVPVAPEWLNADGEPGCAMSRVVVGLCHVRP